MGNSPIADIEKRAITILSSIEDLNIEQKIEVIANVLISSGMNYMDISGEISEITSENIIEIVMNDKKKNGESLHNAITHQGLVMLMWLSKRKSEKCVVETLQSTSQ